MINIKLIRVILLKIRLVLILLKMNNKLIVLNN